MGAAGPFRVRRRRLELCAEAVLGAAVLGAAGCHAMGAARSATGAGSPQAANPAPQPGQVIRIPLEPLGYEPVPEEFLLGGGSSLTADFVDNDHLLVTFETKQLMRREPDEQPQDDDRVIQAVLVELPSGRAVARTEWRVHDRLQYLWNLGHGRFLLRVRDQLTLLAPLQAGGQGALAGDRSVLAADPFRGEPVLDVGGRHIVALQLSSDQDLLTLETMRRASGPVGTANDVTFAGADPGGPVQINFFRLIDTPEGLAIEPAGAVRAPVPLAVPMTTAGILDVLEDGKDRWLFNFDEHAGKVHELAEWDTTCAPRVSFVGHSQFVAFGCRGSEDKPEIAGFNIKGEQMWEQGFYDSYVSPGFVFAPAAGRFALARTIVSAPVEAEASLPAGALVGEEVRVYQTHSGKILLKVNTTPVERAGGNYALSADGMKLAVFEQRTRQRTTQLGDPYTDSATSLVIYPLPALGDEDRASLKEMLARAPVDTGAPIDASLARLSRESESRASEARPVSPAVAARAANAAAATVLGSPLRAGADPAAASADVAAGDQEPGNPAMTGQLPDAPGMGNSPGGSKADPPGGDDAESGPRRAPTLYEPGESPHQPPEK